MYTQNPNIAAIGVNTISILSSIICILLYLFVKAIRLKENFYYIASNQITDLCLCTVSLYYLFIQETNCDFLGPFYQFFAFLLIEWSFVVIFKIHYQIQDKRNKFVDFVFGKEFSNLRTTAICIFFSFLLATMPLYASSFVKHPLFCSISTQDRGLMLFICFYIPFLISIIAVSYMLLKINRKTKERLKNKENIFNYSLSYWPFPILLYISYMPMFINRVLNLSLGPSSSIKNYSDFTFYWSRLHGFFNFVVTLILCRKEIFRTKKKTIQDLLMDTEDNESLSINV